MVRQERRRSEEQSRNLSCLLHLPVNFTCQRVDAFEEKRNPQRRESAVIVKILEVWFISSVPIGIAVGRLLERGSTPLLDATPQVATAFASADRLSEAAWLPPPSR
jgi:hypothetical protein